MAAKKKEPPRRKVLKGGAYEPKNPYVFLDESPPLESPIKTWFHISWFLGMSPAKARKFRDELFEAGVIFYAPTQGPPFRVVAAFPSILRKWATLKAKKMGGSL